MWKNVLEPHRPQMTIYYSACALHAGQLRPHTHTRARARDFSRSLSLLEYVIFIAFPRKQWLREGASMLRLTVHCLSRLYSCHFFLRPHVSITFSETYQYIVHTHKEEHSLHIYTQGCTKFSELVEATSKF
jgi:hypothetical protein